MPQAMLVETSSNFGKHWKLLNYYSSNCENIYPGVSVASGDVEGKISCINHNNHNNESEKTSFSASGEKNIDETMDKNILNIKLNTIKLVTSVRFNLTQFPLNSNLYSIDEMYVNGTCNCHGHASQCIANSNEENNSVSGMVYSSCLCQHNTRGNWCEYCDDLYNDKPWEAANSNSKNECKSKLFRKRFFSPLFYVISLLPKLKVKV